MASSLFNFNHVLTIKLDEGNYLLWKSQIMAFVRGHGYMGFLDGTHPCPPATIEVLLPNTTEAIQDVNPEFLTWQQKDQLLLSGILSSLSQSVHTQMLGVTTSQEAWQRLERIFASNSQARMMQLQLQLVNTKKGALNILDYLTKMKFYADSLAAISQPVSDSMLVLYVLNGLGPEYGPFVTAMTTRAQPVLFADLQGFLLSHEIRLADQHVTELASPTVHNTQRQSSSTVNGQYRNQHSMPNRGGNHNTRGRGRGRGRSGSNHHPGYRHQPSPTSICQICQRYGHTALNCYNRFTEGGNRSKSAAANVATHAPGYNYVDPSWYPDSGATHHVTHDLRNIQNQSDYNGNDVVTIGNGTGSYIGESSSSRQE